METISCKGLSFTYAGGSKPVLNDINLEVKKGEICLVIGTSGAGINPARSLGPAIIAAATGVTTDAIAVVWVYIVGPLAGAALAALCYRFLEKENK